MCRGTECCLAHGSPPQNARTAPAVETPGKCSQLTPRVQPRGPCRAANLSRRTMATYKLNRRAVAHCRKLIDARQYVLDSDWGEVAPTADDENAFLKTNSWDEYALWHLGLTQGANDGTKARYAFIYGDFRRVHRTALIACVYRASEWRHKEIELAAHRLLQHLDKVSG